MDDGLRENDPYNGMERAEDAIRPDWDYVLNGIPYKDGKPMKGNKGKKKSGAGGLLGKAEKQAAGMGGGGAVGGMEGLRGKESEPGIVNSVKGKSAGDKGGKGGLGKLKGKGFLKKGGPIAAIGGIFALVAGLMVGASSMMPVAIEEMIIEKFNSVGISSTMASDDWLNVQLNQGVRLGAVKSGVSANLFAFSDYQVEQFESQGIWVVGVGETESETTQITALLYPKDGMYIPVVGSDFLNYSSYNEDELRAAIAQGAIDAGHDIELSQIGTPISAKEALADSSFKTPYTTASKAWRGGASGWFDNIMGDITQTKLSITRNRWVRYVRRAAKGISDSFKDVAKSVQLGKTSDAGVDADTVTKNEKSGEITEEPIKNVDVEEDGVTVRSENVSNDRVSDTDDVVQVEASLSSKALKAASAVGNAANYGCALLEGVLSIYSLVSAYQSLQFLNLVSGFLESVDKVKAGDDNGSPIHEYSTNLTTKADTVYDGEVVAKDKTAMESAGMSWLFGKNSVVSSSDPSVKNVNFENIMSTTSDLFKDIGNKMEIYSKCGYVRAGAAVVDLVTTIISFIPIFGGAVKLGQIGAKEIAKAAIKITVSIALYAVIPIAAKNLAKMMIKDAATEWFGEDLGNAIISGTNKYVGGNGTSGGQSPAGENEVKSYLGARDAVIADEAEYQRAIRSPFDITSRHTFLGSLAYSIIPMAYSSGLMANMSSVSSLVSSSAIAMLPTANAIDEQSVLTSTGSCDLLEKTGAIGDGFCNPYIITDVSTMSTSPLAVNDIVYNMRSGDAIAANDVYENVGSENFDDNGKIKENSNLAKYITYCGQRTSQYGIKDATIYDSLVGSGTAKSIISVVPVVGSLNDIADGITTEANWAWLTGSACVASEDNAYWEGEYKWYQRYAENQRLLENMNPGYTSTVTAYLRDYYEKNPLDQSLEGTLARFTGMSKEKVEDTFALIEYFEFLDEYDATERYAFGDQKLDDGEELRFDNENSVAENIWVVLLNQISYADVRNRSFAV